jgi:KDO2-lipid IV(A) lauroyltransferase
MRRAGIADPPAVARRLYRDLGRGALELLELVGLAPAERGRVLARVAIERDAAEALRDALAGGPVVLAASHTGNWELAAAAAAALLARAPAGARRLAVVAKPLRKAGVDRFAADLRRALDVDLIAPAGAFGAARRALARGDVVVLPIDQVPERQGRGLSCAFLGASALVDRAPATLAWRTGATILVVAAERDGARHHVRLLHRIAPPSGGEQARAFIDRATRAATAELERFVLARPEAWLWLHRRWRAPRPSASSRSARLVASRQPG